MSSHIEVPLDSKTTMQVVINEPDTTLVACRVCGKSIMRYLAYRIQLIIRDRNKDLVLRVEEHYTCSSKCSHDLYHVEHR